MQLNQGHATVLDLCPKVLINGLIETVQESTVSHSPLTQLLEACFVPNRKTLSQSTGAPTHVGLTAMCY